MEGSRTRDESHLGLPGETTITEGKLGVLGKTTCSDTVSIYPETTPTLTLWSLRPSELVRLLNSTPLGEVICERKLRRHRMRAGNRIGEGRRINVCRYAAWLYEMRQAERKLREHPKGDLSVRTVLQLLKHQGYRCALTGRMLTPESVALDHIVPVSRGGHHHIENAQILHKVVNRAKGTLTNEDFVQMCRDVVTYMDGAKPMPITAGPVKLPGRQNVSANEQGVLFER